MEEKLEVLEQKPKQTMTDVIAKIYHEGTNYDSGKVLTIAKSIVSTIKKDNKLLSIAQNDKQGLIDCINQAISLGLTIDANQYCYLVPYGQKITIQIGYKGYIYKVKQANKNVRIQACLVREGDDVEIKKISNNDIVNHNYKNPFNKKSEDIVGVYSIITFEDGKSIVETLNDEEIKLIKSKAKTKYIWNEWKGEMIKKSVLKRACKIHFSSEIENLNDFDNQFYDLNKKPSKTAGLEAINE